jgi:hypothetical protein
LVLACLKAMGFSFTIDARQQQASSLTELAEDVTKWWRADPEPQTMLLVYDRMGRGLEV